MSPVDQIAAKQVAGGDPALEQLIVTGLGLIHVLQVYTSSMVCLAVWDWMVCFRQEYYRVWKRDWSLVKCLYIWTRYYGLACFAINLWLFNGNFTFDQCKTLHKAIAATCMFTTLGSEAILAVRTYAFLSKRRWVGILLASLMVAETGFLLYVSIAAVHQTPILVGDVGPCTASDAPGKHVVTGFWLAPVAFDLICTGLTGVQAFRLGNIKSGIVSMFVREGVFYFAAVAAVNVLNAIFMFQSDVRLQNINCFLALVLSQVLCCRLVLNLRSPKMGDGVSMPSGDSSTMRFASNKKGQTGSGTGSSRYMSTTNEREEYSCDDVLSRTMNTVDTHRTGKAPVNIPLQSLGRTRDKEEDEEKGLKIHVERTVTQSMP